MQEINKSMQRSSKLSNKESQFSTDLKHSVNGNEQRNLTDELK